MVEQNLVQQTQLQPENSSLLSPKLNYALAILTSIGLIGAYSTQFTKPEIIPQQAFFNLILIAGTTYVCCLVRLISNHMVSKIESQSLKFLARDFVEVVGLVYFIGYRALQPEIPQIVTMQMPEAYTLPKGQNPTDIEANLEMNLVQFQWLHLRFGVALFEVFFSKRTNFVLWNSLYAAFCFCILFYLNTPRYVGLGVGMLTTLDQWRYVWGLTALVKCQLIGAFVQIFLFIQCFAMSFMVCNNARMFWYNIELKAMQKKQALLAQEQAFQDDDVKDESLEQDNILSQKLQQSSQIDFQLLYYSFWVVFAIGMLSYLYQTYKLCFNNILSQQAIEEGNNQEKAIEKKSESQGKQKGSKNLQTESQKNKHKKEKKKS